ncbi:MAG TPA: M24 family metallopeptidase [Anaerolineaceae bacterium]
MSEFEIKQAKIQALLVEHHLDAILLQRASSFAWATCGASSYINTASTTGAASLLITPTHRYLVTTNIEATRLEQEEHLAEQGWEFKVTPWEEPQALASLTKGLKIGADFPYPGAADLSADMAKLRSCLTPEECERFRWLGRQCAAAMQSSIYRLKPGMSEFEIAAMLGAEVQAQGIQPIVNLIATDERIFSFRHPLPTSKRLERYAMLVLCGRWRGLVCSISRLAYFGSLPADLQRKMLACARVDAVYHTITRPGITLGTVIEQAQAAYAQSGFANEWRLHHQGGAAGYESREFLGKPGSTDPVYEGQVYAWNPSITGVKSEDTLLVGEISNENLTATPLLPSINIAIPGGTCERPAILEIL